MFLTLWPDSWPACAQEFEIFAPPQEGTWLQRKQFRLLILALVTANLLASWICEDVLTDKVIGNIDTGKPKKYETITKELRRKPDWPPLTDEVHQVHNDKEEASEKQMKQIQIEHSTIVAAKDAFEH